MVVAEIIEIQIDFHMDHRLCSPHEPSKFQGHCQIGVPLCSRVTVFALLRLFALPHINNCYCGDIFSLEGFHQES